MIRQISTIIRKEWLDLIITFFSPGNLMVGPFSIVIFSVAVGVYEPAQMGLDWLQSPIMVLFLALLIPLSIIGFVSPDSIVGERRRNTLEPLLASPVSSQAFLLGKIGIAVILGWGFMLLNTGLGLLTVNLVVKHSGVLLYSPNILFGVIVMGLLISILLATIGVGCSLYSNNLLETQYKMGQLLFVPMLLAASAVSPYMPDWWRMAAVQIATSFGTANLFHFLILILFAVDVASAVWIMVRFNRKQLIS
jgi:ABC-type Na+ efflux pump permease subunit